MKSGWADIKKKYKIYSTKKYNQIKRTYSTPKDFEDAVYNNTYFMLITYLDKAFKNADELALQLKPSLKSSLERCIWVCQYLIKKREGEGHTVINASILARMVHKDYPDVFSFIVDAVNHPMFHYENDTKKVSLKQTWNNEMTIAETIKDRIENPINSKMNWEKYKKIDDIELTDEQLSLLKAINENSIVMLNGSAGT